MILLYHQKCVPCAVQRERFSGCCLHYLTLKNSHKQFGARMQRWKITNHALDKRIQNWFFHRYQELWLGLVRDGSQPVQAKCSDWETARWNGHRPTRSISRRTCQNLKLICRTFNINDQKKQLSSPGNKQERQRETQGKSKQHLASVMKPSNHKKPPRRRNEPPQCDAYAYSDIKWNIVLGNRWWRWRMKCVGKHAHM